MPYVNQRAPKLQGRTLASDPAQGLWQAATHVALRAELLLAALFDKNRLAPYFMSGLAGALTGMVSASRGL